jgi:hypothetical protein
MLSYCRAAIKMSENKLGSSGYVAREDVQTVLDGV